MFRVLLPLLLFLPSPSLWAGITIGLENTTIDGEANYVTVFYVATTPYASPPFNFWNSQLFTLRWSTSLGAEVIRSSTNTAAYSFLPDGAARDGGDGFYYQKFTAAAVSVVQPIAEGARLDVLRLEVSHPTITTGDFELITRPNAWVEANFGVASVNAAVGGEQFLGFAPARVEGVALPVDLLDFRVTAQEKDILVSWSTSREEAASHFVVERSP
ncbi:MAG: hypothetical protein AAFZ52_11115, partial [Bacteroidota bacterium]